MIAKIYLFLRCLRGLATNNFSNQGERRTKRFNCFENLESLGTEGVYDVDCIDQDSRNFQFDINYVEFFSQ